MPLSPAAIEDLRRLYSYGWSTLVSCRNLQSLTVPKGTVVSEDVFGSRREDRELLQKLKIVYT